MRVRITGRPENKKLSKTLIREATHFFTNLLMTKKSSRGIFINLIFNELERETAGEIYIADNNTDPFRPKNFEIFIDTKMGYKPTLRALAHELVHMDQLTKGRLYNYSKDDNKARFDKKIIHQNKIDYYFLPWEIEAHGKEVGMYVIFQEYLKEKENGSK